jgi:predicted ATPase (AAA+ superfamily)
MLPMSLYETGESNGSVSLSQIMDDESYDIDGVMSDLRLEILFIAACRGGWSRCLALSLEEAKLEIAKDYFRQIYQKDIIAIDGVRRNQELARTLIWSYARNMATTAKKSSIFANVKATQNTTENGVKVIPVGCLKD